MTFEVRGSPDPRLRILVVDDHQRARHALARRLNDHPRALLVGHTDDVLEAHELVASHRPHVALVDPNRTDGLGKQVLSSLAALVPARRPLIVLHVAYFNPELWQAARAAGADDVVLKRIGGDALVDALFSAVRHALPRERWPQLLHA